MIVSTGPAYRASLPPNALLPAKRFAYGAGSALLMFSGADTTSEIGSQAWQTMELGSLEGLLQSIFGGPSHGPLQIAAAVAVFLSAGKCISRVARLAVVFAVLVLHSSGVTVEDAATFLKHFFFRLDSAAAAFLNAAPN
tara:strand:- start:228 stop:644 length:417 start_codon:yes stop_codon:yes gene_type:complete